MKLLVVIVQDQDSNKLAEELTSKGYRSTKLASTGGFLRVGNTTLLVGVDDEQVDGVLKVVRSVCHTREKLVVPLTHADALGGFAVPPVSVQVGGAVVFVLNVDQFHRISAPETE